MIKNHDGVKQKRSSVPAPLRALAKLLACDEPTHDDRAEAGHPVSDAHSKERDPHTTHHSPTIGIHKPEGEVEPLLEELYWAVFISMTETYSGTGQVNGLWDVRDGSYVRSSAPALNRNPGMPFNADIGDVVRQAWPVMRSQDDVYITVDYNIGNGVLALIDLTDPATLDSFASPIDWTRIAGREWLDNNSRGLGYFYDDNVPPSLGTTEKNGVEVKLPSGGLYILIGGIKPKPPIVPGPDPRLWVRFRTPFTVTSTVTLDQEPTLISEGTLRPGNYSNQMLGASFAEPGPQFGGILKPYSGKITLQLTGALLYLTASNFSAVRASNGLISVIFNGTVSPIAGRTTSILTLPIQYQPIDPTLVV